MIVISKRGSPSNSKHPLENFAKLSKYISHGSALIQKEAKESGIVFTIMKKGKIYQVLPCGKEIEDQRPQIYDNDAFELIVVPKAK